MTDDIYQEATLRLMRLCQKHACTRCGEPAAAVFPRDASDDPTVIIKPACDCLERFARGEL